MDRFKILDAQFIKYPESFLHCYLALPFAGKCKSNQFFFHIEYSPWEPTGYHLFIWSTKASVVNISKLTIQGNFIRQIWAFKKHRFRSHVFLESNFKQWLSLLLLKLTEDGYFFFFESLLYLPPYCSWFLPFSILFRVLSILIFSSTARVILHRGVFLLCHLVLWYSLQK